MTVLLADTSIQRLQTIALTLNQAIPDAFVLSASDPLMAAKFAMMETVDILIAHLYMPRMNGLKLCEFVREKSAHARLCLTATSEEFAACAQGWDATIHCLALPVTEAALLSVLLS